MFNMFSVTFAIPGTLSADALFNFIVPCACTLRAASVCADNASTAVLNVGTHADPDGYLDAVDFGDSNVPTLFDLDDFNGDLVSDQGNDYPHLAKDANIEVGIDVDGSTDPDDACVVLWFMQG